MKFGLKKNDTFHRGNEFENVFCKILAILPPCVSRVIAHEPVKYISKRIWASPLDDGWIIYVKVVTWWRHHMKRFPYYWPFVRGIHLCPVDFFYKASVNGSIAVCLMLSWTHCRTNIRFAGESNETFNFLLLYFVPDKFYRNNMNFMGYILHMRVFITE